MIPKFPEPPSIEVLRQVPVKTQTLLAGTKVARIFFAARVHPTTWDTFRYHGPSASRFDHHFVGKNKFKQDRGIMHLSAGNESIPTCLAEVFQVTRIIDRYSRNPILVGFELAQLLTLTDLRSTFAAPSQRR